MPRCPSCFKPLTRVEEPGGIKMATCSNCFGSWISTVALARLARLEAQTPAGDVAPEQATLQDLAATVAESNTATSLRCPQCERPMGKDRYHPMIPVTIDRCGKCKFVWLDAGELALIRKLYRELMTSDDPEIVRRREKIGAVAAQWEGHKSQGPGLATPVPGASGTSAAETFDLLRHLLH